MFGLKSYSFAIKEIIMNMVIWNKAIVFKITYLYGLYTEYYWHCKHIIIKHVATVRL